MLSLQDGFGAREALPVHADEIAVFLLGPDGEHLAPALLVEPHVGIPERRRFVDERKEMKSRSPVDDSSFKKKKKCITDVA